MAALHSSSPCSPTHRHLMHQEPHSNKVGAAVAAVAVVAALVIVEATHCPAAPL